MVLTPAAADVLARRAAGRSATSRGLLTKLHALASLSGGLTPTAIHEGQAAIGRAAVEALLQGETAHRPRRVIQFDEVLHAVCEELAVDPKRVLGTARHKNVVLARALTVFVARSLTSMSYPSWRTASVARRTRHSSPRPSEWGVRSRRATRSPCPAAGR